MSRAKRVHDIVLLFVLLVAAWELVIHPFITLLERGWRP